MHSAPAAASRYAIGLAVAAAIACHADQSIMPEPAVCGGAGTNLVALKVFEAATVRGADLACVRLSGSAEYIVLPQLLGSDLPYAYQPFFIGTPDASLAAQQVAPASRSAIDAPAIEPAQQRLHRMLREREADFGRAPIRAARGSRVAVAMDAAAPPPIPVGSTRSFSVLSSLTEPPRFASVGASLRFSGAHVLLYLDDRIASTYTAGEIASLGALFDQALYGVDHAAFGQESDIDGNGRIIVLFTPAVNSLVAAADCSTMGFATGFFYGFDLSSASQQSNQGEIFYAMVPDPDGVYSCAHSKADVAAQLPTTFVHEFQHMISYGHHVLSRGGAPEVPWLNEGLSHMAEELGSLYFESRYPSPAGRTRPTQLFPDSAEAFITGDLINSYRFLRFSEQYSVVDCAPGTFCATPERGGAWLFLRWLADATGDPRLFDKLVHSDLQGTHNVEAVAGRSFADLFGDFAIASWGDSLIGSPRASTTPTHRFATRNLRSLYSALYEAYGPLGGFPLRFPIEPPEVAVSARLKGAMRPGTFQAFRVRTPTDHAEYPFGFTAGDGVPFGAAHGAQLSILRVPRP